jgi:hypothetical protein
MRRAAKVDSNHADIVKALRDVGARVLDLSAIGDGAPDIDVGFRGVDTLMEIKRDAKAKLKDKQKDFATLWRGKPVVRVNSVSDAFRAIGI